jgi:phosphoribosyl 1,2-cyclic phosphate phosphodiesterase
MKITFLGTGTSQGVPPIGCKSPVCLSENVKDKRLRASIHVEWNDVSIVIDAGPDFRYQMIRAGIHKLDALLFTHEHKDHTAGLDDVRPYNYLQDQYIQAYCSQHVLEALKSQYDYVFSEHKYPGIPLIDFTVIDNNQFTIKDLPILPIQVMHYKLPVFGYRFNNFAYITDANFISNLEIEKLQGLEVLVLNALRREPHMSHFTLTEATNLALKIGAKQTYFTHMSHQIGFHDDVCNELPNGIDLAYDGLQVIL